MPHAVIKGTINLEQVFLKLESFFFREENKILKIKDKFLNVDKNVILIDVFVKENEYTADFFVIVNKRDDGVVVRIHPNSIVVKNDTVKSLLAEITHRILEISKDCRLGETNISDYLEMIKSIAQ